MQVKQCLEAAARGKGYAEGHAGEQQLQAGEQDAAQQLQERLRSQSEAQMQVLPAALLLHCQTTACLLQGTDATVASAYST